VRGSQSDSDYFSCELTCIGYFTWRVSLWYTISRAFKERGNEASHQQQRDESQDGVWSGTGRDNKIGLDA